MTNPNPQFKPGPSFMLTGFLVFPIVGLFTVCFQWEPFLFFGAAALGFILVFLGSIFTRPNPWFVLGMILAHLVSLVFFYVFLAFVALFVHGMPDQD